ncbi:hypothetical protein NUTIK01_14680 [Novosphingobium sp. IK01]|uniref:Uncharacterized protein n=1 Tax=Novosphingobium pituita TaxID=3056842 RepID=A0ABQ6P7A6_9SPHN|nr:hypothetical protein NUTIK01_14680 [Novosphingobium sp. IK01]
MPIAIDRPHDFLLGRPIPGRLAALRIRPALLAFALPAPAQRGQCNDGACQTGSAQAPPMGRRPIRRLEV